MQQLNRFNAEVDMMPMRKAASQHSKMADDIDAVSQFSVLSLLTMSKSCRRHCARARESVTDIIENLQRRRRLFFERQAAEQCAFFQFILTFIEVCLPTPERIL